MLGFPNLADCYPWGFNLCAEQLPTAPDTWLDVSQPARHDLEDFWITAHDVGPAIGIGPIIAPRSGLPEDRYDGSASVGGLGLSAGDPLFLTVPDGSWGPTSDDVWVPVPQTLIAETSLGGLEIGDEPIAITWEPGTSGLLFLSVTSGEPSLVPGAPVVRRLYRLEDDGEYLLDVTDLGWNDATYGVSLTLARVEQEQVEVNGNPLLLSARSQHVVTATRAPIDGRTRVEAADTCDGGLLELDDGAYWGRLTSHSNQSELASSGSCTDAPTPGADGYFQLTVAPGERVHVEGERFDGDGSLYLLEGCDGACLDGSDIGGVDIVEYTNHGDVDISLVLVVDSYAPTTTTFLLDVKRDTPVLTSAASGTCGADEWVEGGRYTMDYQDALGAPVPAGCGVGSDASLFLPVQVPPMSQLIARPRAPLDTSLLYDCSVCAGTTGPSERLIVRNATAVEREAHVVFRDTGGDPTHGIFDADVEIATLRDADLARTCATAGDHEVLETGWHWLSGTLEGYPNNHGLLCSLIQSFSGEEGMVEVLLQPGETLDAEFTQGSAHGVLYVSRGCPDPVNNRPVTCGDGGIGSTSRVSYTNHTGSAERLLLVLETNQTFTLADGGTYDLFVGIYED